MSKFYSFNEFLYRVEKEHLDAIEKVILKTHFPKSSAIQYKRLFELALKALKKQYKNSAFYFFRLAYFQAKSRFQRDRALFWLYLTNNNEKFLTLLSKSYEYNIYKLLALDFLNKPYPNPSRIPTFSKEKLTIDITNPIEWAKVKKKIFNKKTNLELLAKKYAFKNTLPYYLYIKTKASRYKKQFFPLLYKSLLKSFLF